MDSITLHSIWTLVLFICIISIILWAYSGKRKSAFKEAANLVFADEHKDQTGEDKK